MATVALVDLIPRVRLEGAFGVADPSAPDGGKFSVPAADADKLVRQGAAMYLPKAKAAPKVAPAPKSEG
jgi:hypothetical protein